MSHISSAIISFLICMIELTARCQALFHFVDFNQTLGLVFTGDATTTDCGRKAVETIGNGSSAPIAIINSSITVLDLMESGGVQTRRTVETSVDGDDSSSIASREAIFGHRDEFAGEKKAGCPTRLRLTKSAPSQTGSVWYEKRVPVLTGFDTTFSFQVTGHSKICSDHVDPSLGRHRHRSCAVHGGDGFAFVIHGDERGTATIGKDGEDLGYGDTHNSFAVEFDMWTNVASQQLSDDFFEDHISIHGSSGRNDPGSSTALGYARPAILADGKIHKIRIVYLSHLVNDYFDHMTANKNLIQYLKDNGEGRRLGTLAIFIDDGIYEDKPILVIPLNLSTLLDLPQGLAHVGFTSSTGEKWEKHDIVDWTWI